VSRFREALRQELVDVAGDDVALQVHGGARLFARQVRVFLRVLDQRDGEGLGVLRDHGQGDAVDGDGAFDHGVPQDIRRGAKAGEDRFALGSNALLFPDFLKHRGVAVAFTLGFAVLFVFYVLRTLREVRRGEASVPRLLFMAFTVSLAFVIPLFENLDVAFQGFNTWHSLQYLALTWFILSRKAANGELESPIARRISGTERAGRFYAAMVGATVLAGALYLVLWKGLGIPQDKSYYVIVLSFLLIHYFYDHFLFRDFSWGQS